MTQFKRVLCIGDNHLPYLNRRSFTLIADQVIPYFKPEIIIDMGDKYDLFAQKKFAGKMVDPKDEFLEARNMAEQMWSIIRKRAPEAKLFQLKGNHDMRAYKRLMEKAPECAPFFDGLSAWQFPNVETVNDPKDELIIDNTLYTHGHKSTVGAHLADIQYMHNVVIGHLHTAAQVYERVGAIKGKLRWAACTGYIGDPFSEALNYRPMNRYFKWTQGCLLVDHGWPKFVGFEAG